MIDDESEWIELPETGYDAAIAWAVPHGHLGRQPRDDAARLVEGYEELPDGTTVPFARPFNATDRERMDESTNWYLREAGIPEQPSGYRWFIKRSALYGSETADQISHLVIMRGGSDPDRIVSDLTAVIPQVYS